MSINSSANPDMHKKMALDATAKATTELIEKTVVSLDNDALKLLLIQVQHTNIELCIKAAVNSGIIGKTAQGIVKNHTTATDSVESIQLDMIKGLFKWFPYIWVGLANSSPVHA
ncbi:hypothetical protein BOTBODRAFT_413224 [Botryobasidium botryosum FD-172 SS1]|uniref:Uncharacterized protein n=1 Tax=Botryobasidium botryosum (strain FD-172 SS1) TaxID=930990 RepID=A0A067ML36_BOTB1|nr:hypothetical protein BOTBODRAFT_413224 [Botryobasidium botryosum FD-172 SS1]